MFKTVLFPVDRSRETREAADAVLQIVQTCNSRLVLLSVVEEVSSDEDMNSPEEVAQLLKEAQTLFAQQGIEAEVIEKQGKPSFTICDVADEIDANLIVMGCRGLGLANNDNSESVTHMVIDLSPCPVLVIP